VLLQDLEKKKLIHPPDWLVSNTHYLVISGSISFGTNLDTSDFDCLGWAIPRKNMIFPYTEAGYIKGFGKSPPEFDQWIKHHIFDKDAQGGVGRTYDLTIFGIVKYFNLCLTGNPSSVETLFVDHDCILHCSQIAQMVRDERKIFLSKSIIPALRGYAMSMYRKCTNKGLTGRRVKEVEEKGADFKRLSHCFRLTLEAEQILQTGDLDLRRDRETIKAVRSGVFSFEDATKWFTEKEIQLQNDYDNSTLLDKPNEEKVKALLLNCLEHHFGDLSKCVNVVGRAEQTLKEIRESLDRGCF
jgi:predicted nucleotidyltransferase